MSEKYVIAQSQIVVAEYESSPNFATWAVALWVWDGMRESRHMRAHLMSLLQANDVATFEGELVELLER